MIRSNVRRLRSDKEAREARKLTLKVMAEETNLAPSTLRRLLDFNAVERIDGSTLEALCDYFACEVGDILERVPNTEGI